MQEQAAADLMDAFAERTGLKDGVEPRRYLWTDAFALITASAFFARTGEARWRNLAETLVDQVHGVLGRHRADDPRDGWLSGLPESEGARHPTLGGLRIGKPLPERAPDEPFDERLEWDRDGQYWHYLTKWMEALSRAASVFEVERWRTQAVELARAATPRFMLTRPGGAPAGPAWKMSVDLSRPLVPSASPHDALDGHVTLRGLDQAGPENLKDEIAVLGGLSAGRRWTTDDSLGLGGLLLDAARLAAPDGARPTDMQLFADIIDGVDEGLARFVRQGDLQAPAAYRLGFRELGLAIGLQTLPAIETAAARAPGLSGAIERLRAQTGLAERVNAFWCEPENQRAATWRDHRDINEVMLAASLSDAWSETGPAA